MAGNYGDVMGMLSSERDAFYCAPGSVLLMCKPALCGFRSSVHSWTMPWRGLERSFLWKWWLRPWPACYNVALNFPCSGSETLQHPEVYLGGDHREKKWGKGIRGQGMGGAVRCGSCGGCSVSNS